MFPKDASDETSLIKCADAAMYKAKQEGKDSFRFFSSDIKTQSIERLQLENELRHALQRGELVIYYQAKRHMATGVISGVEALLRWRHPDRGLLSPGDFIALAEETGLIVPIGKWVAETACAQIMEWQELGLPAIPIAINLSPRQFMHEHLLGDIEDALQKSGMPANLLELEITESMLMHDLDRTEQLLRAIRMKGVRIAIDDFGTGYSSLSRLKRLPIDTLKIDQSFVRGILTDAKDRAMTEAILTLGLALDLTLVGEGVETEEQESFLRKHGCHQMQGFLFSKPIPGEDFIEFVAAYNMRRVGHLSAKMREEATTTEGVDHSWEPGDRMRRE
jgi:EAL domain-containing protein (putative c-di-GMP-specific phosphodiesterase class I)